MSSALLACPVQAPDGRMLGVLALAADGFSEDELHSAGVFADLAGVALDRSELLGREERRTHEELMLNRAVHALGGSLELDDVYRAIVDQAAFLSGASKVLLTRQEPASRDLRVLHSRGFSERVQQARFVVGEGMIGRVAQTGEPYVSREIDRAKFLSWVIEEERVESFAHVPLSIGARLFGVLTVADERPGVCDDALLARLEAFGLAAAGAIANALDFSRERRVALALTRGFVPGPLPELEGFDAGLVFEPSGHAAGGGDFFGIWRQRDGSVAVLVGDVSGKGIEVAAISAMVRFFVEARTYDAADPAEVMSQTNALLRGRLPGTTFVPAVMIVIDGAPDPLVQRGPHPAAADRGRRRRARAARHRPAAGARRGRGLQRRGGAAGARRPRVRVHRRAHRGAARGPPVRRRAPRRPARRARAHARRRRARAPPAPRGGGLGARARRRHGHPRAAAAGVIEIRHEPPDSPPSRGACGTSTWRSCASASARTSCRPRRIFGTVDDFRGPNSAWLVLYDDGEPVACAGLRELEPGIAEIKRMFVTPRARGRGYARRLLAELEGLARDAGQRRMRLFTTDMLPEAMALYASAGYTVRSAHPQESRTEFWLEKAL